MSDNAFVDSNIWLYAFFLRPGEEALHERAKKLIEVPARYVISDQVIAEVSSNLLRKAGMSEDALVEIVSSFYSRCRVVGPGHETHRKASRLRTGVRQLNLIFREFLMDSPVFTRVPAAVFENQCGGTSCKKQAFIDANISADKVAACL